ncbi:MAG: divalent metal cation transporter [Acidobacteria bacterium]|nr:MAG: divalent metal cation transporter [Acidobacteriota bacterium]REK01639.1 MAG: divalent metal cation transporter [Acidobacteriota bacterium]REK14595.1 MAG: divalent metal cation transporter [Acidobacteriota bacterium]REK45310.1 MAG: divalent metal cation transporter [Acidobacteriota bacterium]
MNKKLTSSVFLGAAFLMATSAVGPGFLTQTAKFTKDYLASFGFVILLSVVLDIVAQLNIWRVLAVSGKRGQDVANETIFGSGYVLAILIVFGGLAFNIGNIAGAGLGFNVLFGLAPEYGALISACVGIGIFLFRDAGKAMDLFVKVLGFVMLGLIVYVVAVSRPDVGEAAYRTFLPETISPFAIVTLVGGTVGGYITFAGAHRLIDAGVTGEESLGEINRSATTGIVLTAVIRFLLFLAAFGVIGMGLAIDDSNPPASVFQNAAGEIGYKLFGVVMWAAAITSVVGAAYTSVSFLKTFNDKIEKHSRYVVIAFIAFSTLIFVVVGRPVMVLILAGTFNGFILPVGLAIILLAARRSKTVGNYIHPMWLQVTGWLVVAVMLGFSLWTIVAPLFGSS